METQKRIRHEWTSEEVTILKEKYPKLGYNIPELLERHHRHQLTNKAVRLRISYEKERHFWGVDVCPSPEWCWWFCGLFDGEGCFSLSTGERGYKGRRWLYPTCRVQILMRDDELPIFEDIMDKLKIGAVDERKQGNYQGTLVWRSADITDIINVIVPLFNTYPLRTKKGIEWPLWREAVFLCQKDRVSSVDRISAIQLQLRDLRGRASRLTAGWTKNPDSKWR